jgi:hypothetical protein
MPVIEPGGGVIPHPPLPTVGPGLTVTIGSGGQAGTFGVVAADEVVISAISCSGTSSNGVSADSNTKSGVYGHSAQFDAVVGETNSVAHAGVTGRNLTTGANGGVGIYGVGGHFAGKFDGTLQVNGDAYVTGTLNVTTDIILAAGDCAEEFDVETSHEVEPGTVMVLDDSGSLRPSERGYDRKVAGVISGAGEYRPGVILDRRDSSRQRVPIALAGKVYCKADAQYAPIEIGDLLTTSPTPGHAMRAVDPLKAFGAVIGKALQRLPEGCGLIPILVALQ